ncbi:MAG: hypothetical protein KAT56_00525 [Sedimentisphaerales bacterium]|nr:hypothetical protein [Sedimentisphaerales bacterium]
MKKRTAAVPAALKCIAAVPAALNKYVLISIIIGLLIMMSVPTNAALTEPLGPDLAAGKVLFETLDSLYGLDNLTRVDDYDSSIVDQYWTFADEAVTATALARAKFAGFTHKLGFLPGPAGGKFKSLFNTGRSYYGVFDEEGRGTRSRMKKKASFAADKTGPVFRFGLKILNHRNYIWSSAPSDNVVMPKGAAGDGIDHMITFQVTGNDGYSNNTVGNYIIAWEDLMADNTWGKFDGDYGDLVVELSGVHPVPEPYSIALFSLAGLALLRYPRRT